MTLTRTLSEDERRILSFAKDKDFKGMSEFVAKNPRGFSAAQFELKKNRLITVRYEITERGIASLSQD